MAKATVTSLATPKKKTTSTDIVSIAETILNKLSELHLDSALQSDIVWCLGSYQHDHNPVGLYEKVGQALDVFKAERTKKTKGVTAKLITDIEKAIATK